MFMYVLACFVVFLLAYGLTIVLTSVGRRTRESEESDERRFAEERRIEYVACTRRGAGQLPSAVARGRVWG